MGVTLQIQINEIDGERYRAAEDCFPTHTPPIPALLDREEDKYEMTSVKLDLNQQKYVYILQVKKKEEGF